MAHWYICEREFRMAPFDDVERCVLYAAHPGPCVVEWRHRLWVTTGPLSDLPVDAVPRVLLEVDYSSPKDERDRTWEHLMRFK